MLDFCKSEHVKRNLSMLIAIIIVVSSLMITPLISSADTPFKRVSKVYNGDFSSGDTLDGWILTSPGSANIGNGVLSLSISESAKSYASAIIRPDTDKYLNQQIRVDYKCDADTNTTGPVIWLRASLREEGNAQSLVGYFAIPGVSGSINKYEIWKRYFDETSNNYKEVQLCRAGRIFPTGNATLGAELNVSGSNPTVITLRTFKNGNISQTGIAVDSEPSLQSAGSAAVSAYKTQSSAVNKLDIVSIAYDSADKVSKGYYAVETGSSIGRLSTMVSVYQDKEYVFSAKSYNAESYEPFFIRYDTDAQSRNNANSSIIDLDMSSISMDTQDDITTHTYAFKISDISGYAKTTNGYYTDANGDYQVPMFLGVDFKDTNIIGNKYFGFELKEVIHDTNDVDKDGNTDEVLEYGPNLIANGDFKYGFSGWSDKYHSTASTLDWGCLCGKASTVSDGTTVGGLAMLYQKDNEIIEKKEGLFNYTADFNNSEVLSDWYLSSIPSISTSDGKLNITASDSNKPYSSLMMRPDETESYLNNTVRVDYEINDKSYPIVWTRAKINNRNSLSTVTGYFVKTNIISDNKARAELYKRYVNNSGSYIDDKIMNCGVGIEPDNSTFGIEIAVEGSNPTVIAVRTYKGDELVGSNTVIDYQTDLQTAGSAGLSVFGPKDSTVKISGFSYTSDDNVIDEYYAEQTAKCNNDKIFAQQISADTNKSYTFSATVEKSDDYQPFYIAYKDKGGKVKEISIKPEDCVVVSEKGLKTYTYTVDFSKMDYTGYTSANYRITDGENSIDLIPVIVGVKLSNDSLKGNKYSVFHFNENKVDGSKGPNLIINSEFKSGLLGWTDSFTGKAFDNIGKGTKVGDTKSPEEYIEVIKADAGLASLFGTAFTYVSDFTSADGWILGSGNSVIGDGKLKLNGNTEKNNYIKNSAFYSEKKLNQLVITEFYTELNNQQHINQFVWARVNQKDVNDINTVVGYYAKFNTNSALEVYKRILNSNGEYEDVLLGKAGNPFANGDSRVRRVELAVEGSNPTKISASVYKYGAAGTANENIMFLMCKNTFFDNDADLQNAGMSGVSISLNESKNNNTIDITKFEYYSTDGEDAKDVYVEKPTSSTGRTNKTDAFGQILAIDPNETYVVEALACQDNLGLWLDYKNSSSTNNTQTVLLDNYGLVNKNEKGQRVVRYEFNLTKWSKENGKEQPYGESMYTNGGKQQTLITFGFNIANKSKLQYSGFKIYAKNDAERKNLLTNAEFKMGLYAWLDNCGSKAYISCNCAFFAAQSTTTPTNIVNLIYADQNSFDNIFNVKDDETIVDYEKYDGEYMLHIKDNATFALGKIGQMIELETDKTYIYEVKYKYIVNKSVDPYVFCYKDDIDPAKSNNAKGRITLSWDYQEIDADSSTIYCEFHIPNEAYIYNEKGEKAESGKAKAMIAISTGQPGADCYFYGFKVYEKDDAEKTNLMGENNDFKNGWKNWILAKAYEVEPMTYERWTVADFPVELLPYDFQMFVNDTNDKAWNDGNWAAKFGKDDEIPVEIGSNQNDDNYEVEYADFEFNDEEISDSDNIDVGNGVKTKKIRRKKVVVTQADNSIWYVVGCVAILVVLAAGVTLTIVIVKKRKSRKL